MAELELLEYRHHGVAAACDRIDRMLGRERFVAQQQDAPLTFGGNPSDGVGN